MTELEEKYAKVQDEVGTQKADLESLAWQTDKRELEGLLARKEKENALLQEEILILQKDRDSAEKLAETDVGTGLDNRRAFHRKVRPLFNAFAFEGKEGEQRAEPSLTYNLMFLDIDHFKNFNTVYGYQAANEVLKGVAELLKKAMRPGDLIARYGGEEFVVGFMLSKEPGQGQSRSIIAERVRRAVEAATFEYNNVPMKVTTSIGMSQVTPGDTYEEFEERASEANKKAKDRGRNRVVISELDDELNPKPQIPSAPAA